MKAFAPAFLIVLLFTACASGGWRVVAGDEFTVEFPGEPKDTATMEGDYSGAKLYYQPQEGGIDSNVYYAVSMYTLPDSVEMMGEVMDDLLLKDAEIYAWAIGAIVTDSGKVVKSGTYEGREYKIFLSQNAGVVTMRKFVKGKHLYTLMVITGNAYLDNSYIYRFLDSFKLKQ